VRRRLGLGLPRGVLLSWRWRRDLVTVVSETIEDVDCWRAVFGQGDTGTAVRVDVVERDEDEEAEDRERGGGVDIMEGEVSGFSDCCLVPSCA
jgi:hypothetical protein